MTQQFDSFGLLSLLTYSLIAIVTLMLAPRRELTALAKCDYLLLFSGTAMAYLAPSPWMFLLGWGLTIIPFCLERSEQAKTPRLVLIFSTVSLALGFLLAAIANDTVLRRISFGLIVLAALLRKGIFPFHFWIPIAFERGSLPKLNLLMNSHLGAFLIIRFGVPLLPEQGAEALSFLAMLAIFTAVYTALLAIVAQRPRRILALLCISQASFILAGVENRNLPGVTGALMLWWVVAFATTGLLSIYCALESRTTEVMAPKGYLGLAFHAPRLAVFFGLCALALVGLPGTAGFAAEDLLFHGSLNSHPLLGAGLPLATALNAITAFRLLSMLFFGRRGQDVPAIPDARLLERLALAVPVAVLVGGGLFPSLLVALLSPAAASITGMLPTR